MSVDLQDKKKDKEKATSDDISGPLVIGAGLGELCFYVIDAH